MIDRATQPPGTGLWVLPIVGLVVALIGIFIPNMYIGLGTLIAAFLLGLIGMIVSWPASRGAFVLSIIATIIGLLGILISIFISIAWQSGALSG